MTSMMKGSTKGKGAPKKVDQSNMKEEKHVILENSTIHTYPFK
jgi:hypothetical protein